MNKKGFTLLELLVVVAIVAIVSVGATVSFGNIEHQTAEEELRNKYLQIQRAGHLYLDLHNDYLESFVRDRTMYLKLGDLYNENYIDEDIENPVTGEDINLDYYVKMCISGQASDANQTVKTCVVNRKLVNGIESEDIIADNLGNYENFEANACTCN